ncbi:uncharacterized protein si:ch211-245h14.1 isoform X1 [Megalobrama amblycephala]|uniref:uncharacterized protein si:ch211-245h14.1 isoform X1 n=1 Tax=Megalobrama amblycephala TaxID=75352 RepID=UPI00201411A4|nr:uncharacterized protein si:ch211-245h14.1 isoform X1 [Megalobrama amblycephala]
MSSSGSSWLPAGLTWMNPNTLFGFTKEKKGRALREQIKAISGSTVLDEAGIDDAQVLTLTREDLNELFPGICNFQLRRTIMSLITDTMKDSLRSGPETFAGALKHLMRKNNSNDAAVQDVLKESLRAFREMEEQLKATQAFLKPYIEVLNSLTEASARKEQWDTEGTSSRGKFPSPSQTDLKSPTITTHFEPSVRVHPFTCGRTLGVDMQILKQLKGVTESGLWDCQLILVFCPVVSRSGTDIEEALRKIPADKPAVLVTMHHTFNPNYMCPSYNISSSQANIVEHVNILFHDSQQGLLRCATNEHAITKLQSVLNRHK